MTRDKVRAIAAQLGYAPNASARGLASARSYLIALAYDNENASYVLQLQLGATRRCRQNGFHLVIEPVPSGPAARDTIARLLDASRLHGLILAPPMCENADVLDLIAARGLPCVRIAPLLDREGMAAVRSDDRGAARTATDYLLALGHSAIGFVTGPPSGPAASLRLAGFDDAIAAHGKPIQVYKAQGDFTFRAGFDQGMALLDRADRPSAIFAANDEMAFGVIAAAHRLRLTVPHAVSVLGFDDSPAARTMFPQLTTVRQPTRDMAAAAAAILLNGDDRAVERNFTPELVVRASTARAPAGGARA